ncbi:MAG: hypothetical protein QW272_08125 [Candidatus Methanomethylicaceae archaeon]
MKKSKNMNEIRRELYEKYLNKNYISNNKEIKFNCLNCKKEVKALIGSSLGYTLLCKDCFFEKYEEYQKSKHMSFLNVDTIIRKAWIEYFKNMVK